MVQPKYLKKKVPNWRSRTYLYKVGFWVHDRADQCSNDIRERLSRLSVQPADLVTTVPYHRDCYNRFVNGGVPPGLAQKIKQNPRQPMILYPPYSTSYSPIDMPYGTLSNCWNITQSLVDKPCGAQPRSVWYHKTWMPWSYYQNLVSGLLSSFVIAQRSHER